MIPEAGVIGREATAPFTVVGQLTVSIFYKPNNS